MLLLGCECLLSSDLLAFLHFNESFLLVLLSLLLDYVRNLSLLCTLLCLLAPLDPFLPLLLGQSSVSICHTVSQPGLILGNRARSDLHRFINLGFLLLG